LQKSRVLGVEEIERNFASLSKVKKKNFKDWEKVVIEKLKFKYDESFEADSLNITNFEFKKGEKIALIGESGSGKSTLLKVIHGMYEKASAKVNIDGKTLETNFQDVNLHSTLVPQEPEVFSASIKENITLLTNFSDEEVLRATTMAEFHDVAEELPNKYDSVVNEKGVNLSGGQKQRLALSRALLFSKDKEVILLDESTSSVDPINEVKIYKNIFENFQGVTFLASIHKMNLLKYFDRIVILHKGEIKIEGSFEFVLEHDEDFRKTWEEFVKENER
jgi:ABC-type bacteriocin/lantibiotic exporter with double-glycine peptidase domain